MLSNKLTFSLASLVVLLVFTFGAMPVMGHRGHTEPHPQVTIREYTDAYSMASPRSRSNFKVLVEFTLDGASTGTLFASTNEPNTVTIAGLTGDSTDADITIAPGSGTQVGTKHAWVFTLDLADETTTSGVLTVRDLEVTVPENLATAADDSDAATTEQSNEEKVTVLSNLPPATDKTVSLMVAPKMDAGDMAIEGEYIVTFTFSEALTANEVTAFTGALVVDPDTFMTGAPVSATIPAANVNKVFTLPITLPRSIDRITIRVDPEFAAVTANSIGRVAIPPSDGGGTLAQPTGVMIERNTAETGYEVSWTEPTDKAGIGGYYVRHNPTVFVAVGTTLVTIVTADRQPPTSVVVWSTGDESDMSPTTAPTGVTPASPTQDLTMLPPLSRGGNGGNNNNTNMTIAANGFLVLVHSGAEMNDHGIVDSVPKQAITMPNLAEFFDDGGIITLKGPAGQADTVKIAEIMWGTDASIEGTAKDHYSQWIELYNRTDADIMIGDLDDGSGWNIVFSNYSTVPTAASATVPGAVDSVGNIGSGGYWDVEGSSGRTIATENVDERTLVSMYRKLKDLGDTSADNHGKNNGDPLRAGAWDASVKPRRNLNGNRTGSPGAYPPTRISADPTAIDRSTVYITEIGNLADGSDWIELYNASSSAVNIKNWIISVVDAEGGAKDKTAADFAA